MIQQYSIYSGVKHQNGAVLIISLMILIILTMLGISAMDSTKLQTRMAVNTAENNRALQAAEVGVAQAINDLSNNAILNAITETPVKTASDGKTYGSYDIQSVSIKQGSGDNAIQSPVRYAIRSAECTVVRGNKPYLPIYIESSGKSRNDDDYASKMMLGAGMIYSMPTQEGSRIERGC